MEERTRAAGHAEHGDAWRPVPVAELSPQHPDHGIKIIYTSGDVVTGTLRQLEAVSSESFRTTPGGGIQTGTHVVNDAGGSSIKTAVVSGELVQVGLTVHRKAPEVGEIPF